MIRIVLLLAIFASLAACATPQTNAQTIENNDQLDVNTVFLPTALSTGSNVLGQLSRGAPHRRELFQEMLLELGGCGSIHPLLV